MINFKSSKTAIIVVVVLVVVIGLAITIARMSTANNQPAALTTDQPATQAPAQASNQPAAGESAKPVNTSDANASDEAKPLALTAPPITYDKSGEKEYADLPEVPESQVYVCSTVQEAKDRLSKAEPGDTIVLKDGTYSLGTLRIQKSGTQEKPIIFRAENIGGVVFTDAAKLYFDGKYIVVSGFTFKGKGSLVEFSKSTTGSSLLNSTMDGCGGDTWVNIYGTYCRVGYCTFQNKVANKSSNREMMRLRAGIEHHALIDHNKFMNFQYEKSNPGESIPNGTECIQVGMYLTKKPDGTILWENTPSYSVFEYNYFYKWYGEIEIISVKSSNNIFRYNTFEDCYGALTLRQADNCEVYGNYFLQQGNKEAGGIRVYGSGHKIYNNYFSIGGSTGALAGVALQSGNKDPLIDPQPAKDVLVAFNTFVDCAGRSILMGTNKEVDPTGCVIANNIFVNSSGAAIQYDKLITDVKYEGNIAKVSRLGIKNQEGFTLVDPLMVKCEDGIYRLSAESPAIGAAVGDYDFITTDIDGQSRSDKKDVGADQYSTSPITIAPIKSTP